MLVGIKAPLGAVLGTLTSNYQETFILSPLNQALVEKKVGIRTDQKTAMRKG